MRFNQQFSNALKQLTKQTTLNTSCDAHTCEFVHVCVCLSESYSSVEGRDNKTQLSWGGNWQQTPELPLKPLMQLRNAKHVAELSTFREIKDAGLSTNLTAQMIRLNRAAVVYNACICKANGHEIWGQLILPLSHFNKNNVSISSHGDCEWRWR